MAKTNQSGFTLVELMIVLAIMSTLSLIAFKGQAALRSQSQFDADADKVVASIAKTRDDSTAGVNFVGNGTGTGEACNGSDTGPTVFAGEVFVANGALVGPNTSAFEVQSYKANPGQDACVFDTQTVSIPSGLTVSGASGGKEVFVRTSSGAMDACHATLTANVKALFAAGSCPVGTWTLNLSDANGHTSKVVVDASGLAKRVN